jgi:hypothetical protein
MIQRWGRGVCLGLVVIAGCSSTKNEVGIGVAPDAAPPPTPANRATGALGEWDTLAPMPTPRGNHCSVAANGFLVVIGGNYKPKGAADFVNIADVHVAPIAADGSLGSWTLAGKTPSPVNSCTAASDGKDVYLVDGIFDDETAGGKVRRATLDDTGKLGAWQELGALPTGVRVLYSNAAVVGGALRAFHARLPDNGDGIALASAPVAGGALGAWQQSTWLTGFRGHPEYALATLEGGATYVYALGGYSSGDKGNEVLADGAGALLDQAGAPGKSFPVRALPKPTSSGQSLAIDGYVFVVGGKDEVLAGKGRSDVYGAKIAADGTLEAWATLPALPQGRTSLALAGFGDFIYVTGGGFDAGGLDTVYAARVRFPAMAP